MDYNRVQDLNKVIAEIRHNKTIDLLTKSIVIKMCKFFKSDGGFILIIDDQKKTIKFFTYGVSLMIDSQRYQSHPMDKIPEMCTILRGIDDYLLVNNLIDEFKDKKNLYSTFVAEPPTSIMAVPIKNDSGKIFGILSLLSKNKCNFNKDDLFFLKNVAEQISVSIQKVLLIDQFNKVVEVSEILFHNFNYDLLVNKLKELYNAEGCSIFLKTMRNGKEIYLLEATTGIGGYSEEKKSEVFYYKGENLTGYIADKKKCLRIHDLGNNQELSSKAPGLNRDKAKFSEIFPRDDKMPRSFLGCCMQFEDEVLGVIRLTKQEFGNYFTPYDEKSIEILSHYITARIRLDKNRAELEAAQELDFLNQQILYFAHDARQSFSALNMNLNTLYDLVPKNSLKLPEIAEIVNDSKRSSHLTKLYINKLSSYSRTSKTYTKITRNIELKSLVSDIVFMLDKKFKAKRIKVNNLIPSKVQIDFDIDQLQQIFINLFFNSITILDQLQKAGDITIRAEYLDEELDRKVLIEFYDDGPGVLSEDRELIFQRGFSKTGGTGLGLSICKSIIEKHYGTIKCIPHSKGTMFKIKVPKVFIEK